MLTYEQIKAIAAILGWTTLEIENAIAELNDGFMQPDVEFFDDDPETEGKDEEFPQPGFYHRLSAPGYLDCTEWSGPFTTEENAVADMIGTYAE